MLERWRETKMDNALRELEDHGFLHLSEGAKQISDCKEMIKKFEEFITDKAQEIVKLPAEKQPLLNECIKNAIIQIGEIKKSSNILEFGAEKEIRKGVPIPDHCQSKLTDMLYHNGREKYGKGIIALPSFLRKIENQCEVESTSVSDKISWIALDATPPDMKTKEENIARGKAGILYIINEHGTLLEETKTAVMKAEAKFNKEASSIVQMLRQYSAKEEQSIELGSSKAIDDRLIKARRDSGSEEKSYAPLQDKLSAPTIGAPKRMSIFSGFGRKKDKIPEPHIENEETLNPSGPRRIGKVK